MMKSSRRFYSHRHTQNLRFRVGKLTFRRFSLRWPQEIMKWTACSSANGKISKITIRKGKSFCQGTMLTQAESCRTQQLFESGNFMSTYILVDGVIKTQTPPCSRIIVYLWAWTNGIGRSDAFRGLSFIRNIWSSCHTEHQ